MRSFNELRRRTADLLMAEGRRLSGGDAVATGNFCNDKSFYLTYGGLCGLLLFFNILLSTVPIVKFPFLLSFCTPPFNYGSEADRQLLSSPAIFLHFFLNISVYSFTCFFYLHVALMLL